MPTVTTHTVENYLKAIFHLSRGQAGRVSTTQIADHLGIGPFRGPIDAVVHPGQALELLPEQL